MCVYQVPQLSSDFLVDFEDLVIQYLFDEWSIANPGKGATKTNTDGSKVQFRPGFPDYSKPFEVLALQTSTTVRDRNDAYSWHMFTQIEVRIVRAYEIQRDNVSPELGNMEREVERIINEYNIDDINGIHDIIFMGRQRDYGNLSRNTATARRNILGAGAALASSVSWANSTWESVTLAELSYIKERV